VYADWCDDHGEADRAEFIRLGCGLWRWAKEAGLDVWGYTPRVVRRVNTAPLACAYGAVWQRNCLSWRAEWPVGKDANLTVSPLARGFADELIAMSDVAAANFWATATAAAPVQRLNIAKVHSAKRLTKLSGRDRIRSVTVARITSLLAAELFLDRPEFDHLDGLSLRGDPWERNTLQGLTAKFGPRFHKL
jgi:hypothetical protein